ncbi:BREX-1 system adenine-specific DNA-methyltransferase PglX [Planctomicrobium sp. SH527]|uniref:BREX-1 system adenine-specific DNA-methyltransferase PglX n=1 Tax=Planctomicrobium sp. SH527 TaxID=3448123 RepID=UPI003F5B8528
MDQEIRNKLRNVVTQCRKLLEEAIAQELEGKYGIFAKKDQVMADPSAKMTHLSEEEQAARKDILDHYAHIKARGFKPKDALDQLIREIAFTHLNRLCAYKMMEAREVYVGGQKFREAVSRGVNSNGVKFYLAEHPEEERLFNTGHQDAAYRHFLDWLGGALSEEIGVLFNPNDPANRLYPRQKTLDEVLELLNGGGIKAEETELRDGWPQIWSQDETIGWVYQYFTPKELRDAARDPKKGGSQAPRNSYELAFRNQFFTPRYVVEFLTDNTLGRIWYEMRKGDTKLKDQCRYMVRRPTEIFLQEGEQPPKDAAEGKDDLSQEELLKLPVHIPHRPKKDPRELKILDPACGSGHFLLYCFDLLLTIYEEAYADTDLGPELKKDYPTLDALKRDVPRLILAHNLHGIDIDLRASQIAALALWLRCQRAYQDMGLKKDRPQITRSNFVCAEPMPGEEQMLKEFVGQLEPKVLGQVVEVVFDKMKLAGEAGSLLKIEEEIRDAIREAKRQYAMGGFSIQRTLFDKPTEPVVKVFSVKDITDAQFFEGAEAQVIAALRSYAESAQNGQRLQRRLFTDDAVRGFAFVDLCQKRYDVVLMNPPFGLAPNQAIVAKYITKEYPAIAKNLACAFVQRALRVLSSNGMAGTVSDRSVFIRKNYKEIRHEMLAVGTLFYADLGWEVLDEANVEAAALVMRQGYIESSCFFDCRKDVDKSERLRDSIRSLSQTLLPFATYLHFNDEFLAFPNTAFAYWVPRSVFLLFAANRSFEKEWAATKQGTAPADTPRFVRLWWEVPVPQLADGSFARLAHGGTFSPMFRDYSFVILWRNNGKDLKDYVCERYPYLNGNPAWVVKNEDHYFRVGLHFGKRCHCLSVQFMPPGMVFTNEGHAVFPVDAKKAAVVCGLMNTRLYRYVVNTYCGQHKHGGYIDSLPSFDVPVELQVALGVYAEKEWRFRCEYGRFNEVGNWFVGPAYAKGDHPRTLTAAAEISVKEYVEREAELLKERLALEDELAQSARLAEQDWQRVSWAFSGNPFLHTSTTSEAGTLSEDADEGDDDSSDDDEDVGSMPEFGPDQFGRVGSLCAKAQVPPELLTVKMLSHLDPELIRLRAHQEMSYGTGVVFGRWDVRFVAGNTTWPRYENPIEPLLHCPPGALQESDGVEAKKTPDGYPVRINWDGILTDDPEHGDDIERRMRDVLEVIWKDDAEAIESEACEILGVNKLRDYIRKPGKGGFWDDHISRYSKSRRKAPIYWLLQSSKKNYAIWLYYHRLDKDMLFKALVNYVEPKIRLETSRLESLHSQKAAAGESGKEAKRVAKDVERQEDFLSELRDFEDKLRRAANLHLEPDLNDGVVLNIAPLHELVPWKEAKKYWNELMEGQYEWSSIGKQLREKGLVK